jgi:hypothetical protein
MNLHKTSHRLLAGALMTLALGCADDAKKTTTDVGQDAVALDGQDATYDGDTKADLGDDTADVTPDVGTDAGGTVLPTATRLGVIGSDFTSSALSLIDLTTGTVTPNVLNSGTVVSAGGTALSGDVVLAQSPTLDGTIVLVDRAKSVLTWLDPVTLKVTQQINVATGFAKANAQDFVQVSATKGYVTRAGANPKPTADAGDFDEGDDLLVLDLTQKKIVQRIDLAPHATAKGVVAYGGRMAFDGMTVWVPLANLSDDFASAGMGRILAVDAATGTVTHEVDAKDSKNCTKATYLPESKTVAVVCQGFFGDGTDQIKFSALLTIDASAASPSAKLAITATSLGGKTTLSKGPLNGNIGFVDGQRGIVVTAGDFATNAPDRLWLVDLIAGSGEPIGAGGGAFTISGLFGDAKAKKVYLGEAFHAGGDVRVFDLATPATATELKSLTSNPGGVGAVDLGGF